MTKPNKPEKLEKPEVPEYEVQEGKEKLVKLVADREGQQIQKVYSKRDNAHVNRAVPVVAGQLFDMVCPIVKGKAKAPRWAHEPDADELKAIEARNLAAHKEAGDARAI